MLGYRYMLLDWDKSLFVFRHKRRNRSRPSPIWVTQPQARSRHVPPAIPPVLRGTQNPTKMYFYLILYEQISFLMARLCGSA